MDQTNRDTEGMQGDGTRDDAANAADERARAGEPVTRTSRDAMRGKADDDASDVEPSESGER